VDAIGSIGHHAENREVDRTRGERERRELRNEDIL